MQRAAPSFYISVIFYGSYARPVTQTSRHFFHALIVRLSGLYPTGIPVFELWQGWERPVPISAFPPLSLSHTAPAARHTLVNKRVCVTVAGGTCDFGFRNSSGIKAQAHYDTDTYVHRCTYRPQSNLGSIKSKNMLKMFSFT